MRKHKKEILQFNQLSNEQLEEILSKPMSHAGHFIPSSHVVDERIFDDLFNEANRLLGCDCESCNGKELKGDADLDKIKTALKKLYIVCNTDKKDAIFEVLKYHNVTDFIIDSIKTVFDEVDFNYKCDWDLLIDHLSKINLNYGGNGNV